METIHKYWKNNYMGIEKGVDGKAKIGIDESKVIKLGQNTRLMLGMVDWNKYDILIFFVNDNRQTETLIPIIKNNIYIPKTILNDNKGEDEENLATRIYSDYSMSYQVREINQLGYILYKFNHFVWFWRIY